MSENPTTEPEVEETVEQDHLDDINNEVNEEQEPETFPREYVEKLRKENGDYRAKAKRAEDLGQRLHTALVAATGRLASADELVFNPEHLEDPDALSAAIDDLLVRKPYLASRKPRGEVGQGQAGGDSTVDLAGLLRQRAG